MLEGTPQEERLAAGGRGTAESAWRSSRPDVTTAQFVSAKTITVFVVPSIPMQFVTASTVCPCFGFCGLAHSFAVCMIRARWVVKHHGGW